MVDGDVERRTGVVVASGMRRGRSDRSWNLVGEFTCGDREYRVLERPRALPEAEVRLTPREAQVARMASMGLANKEIAYELGIAVATVGVLIARAKKKLGCSRAELRRKLSAA